MAEGDPNFVNSVASLCAQSAIAACDAVLIVYEERRGEVLEHNTGMPPRLFDESDRTRSQGS